MQAGEVEGQSGQGELARDSIQTAGTELAHATLLFQNSEHRLDHRLAPCVRRLTAGERSRARMRR